MKIYLKSFAILMLVSFLISGCGESVDHDDNMMGDTAYPYDAMFIDSMIIHHQGATDMANQALDEATRPEIINMAKDIISAQQLEIDQMRSWRDSWYPGLEDTGGMGMHMGTMMVSTDTSTAFDIRFIEAMIPHHEGAINMARDAKLNAEHNEIRNLADAIITAQEAEIAQMQAWKESW